MARQERVLVVDDEPDVLRAITAALERSFEVVATSSPQKALELAAADSELAVVVADQRMPSMPGDELLRRLRAVSEACTMLVTGNADLESVMRAVNDGSIVAFVAKPWSSAELRFRVGQAATQFRLRRELEQERQVVRDLMASTADAIYFTDREQRLTRVNAAFLRLVGLTEQAQVLGRRLSDLAAAGATAPLSERPQADILSHGEPRPELTHQVSTGDGQRWLSTTESVTRAANGKINGLVSISRDVTERVRADVALRTSEERLRLAFQASKAGLFDWDIKTGHVSYSSTELAEPGNAAMGAEFSNIEQSIHPSDLAALRAAVQTHLEQREPFRAVQVRSRFDESGAYHWYELNAQAAWDDAGQPVRLVGSFLDIEELREAQTRLAQAQKLEGIGQLAAGIAHEINTPTQYVTDNVTFLERAFNKLRSVLLAYQQVAESARSGAGTGAALQELEVAIERAKLDYLLQQSPRALAQSLEGLNHVSTIVKAMKEFSHPSGAEKQLTDIHGIIESSSVVARNEWKYLAEMSYEFDRALPNVPALRNELSQVFLNLIVNAAHAIAAAKASEPGRVGQIRISTSRSGDYAEVRIADSGAGIPESIRARVFEPFFTTKEVGKGTGQGLAIAYSVIVDKHLGSICFETEAGRGTTFIVRLPLEQRL